MNKNSSPLVGPGAIYTVGAAGGKYIERQEGRSFLAIVNAGTVAVNIGFGQNPATAGNASMPIAAGATFNPNVPPGDEIWLAAATGTAPVTIING